MEILFEESIKKDLKNGTFAPVYILFGDDGYLKKHYSDSLIKKICGDDTDFNLQIFDENADVQTLYDAVNQFPMMSDKKCVCLTDYDIEHAEKKDFEMICETVSDVPETTVFIIRFEAAEFNIKKSAKAKKLAESAAKSDGKVVSLNHRTNQELVQMLVRGAKKRGSVLSDNTARYILETVGDDINILTNELEKLCLFVKDEEITEKTVDYICAKTVDASVYEYVKEIMACNVTKALSLLDSMFFMHIEPMIILYTTASSYIDIYRLFAAKRSGKTVADVTADFGYGKKAFTLKHAAANMRKFNARKLKASFDEILKTDKAMKSFSFDERVLLEELTLKLVLIIASEGDAF